MDKIRNKQLATIKFVVFSIIGIVAFFVYIPTGGGESALLIDIITRFLYGIFEPFYNYLVLLFCFIALALVFFIRKSFNRSGIDKVLSVCSVFGTIIVLLIIFGIAPDFLAATATATIANMGRSIIMILCTAFFVPFLLFHGLIDSIGILAKPLMRPVFKTPGLTAMVVATDLLANFSAAILGANTLYKEGKLNYKETAIILTGFCSISIGLMLLFAQFLDLMDYFIFYFISAQIVMCLVTAITVRIPPIRGMSLTYNNDKPTEIAEDRVEGNRLKNAWFAGVAGAEAAPSVVITVGSFLALTLRVIAIMISSTIFVITAGLLINEFTPIFSWLGLIFYPIYVLFGLFSPGLMADARVMATASGLSIVDVFPSVMYGMTYDLSLPARYVLASFPVTIIIFTGGYFTCLMAADFRIKVRYLFILWLERMFLSLIFLCTIAVIFFRV